MVSQTTQNVSRVNLGERDFTIAYATSLILKGAELQVVKMCLLVREPAEDNRDKAVSSQQRTIKRFHLLHTQARKGTRSLPRQTTHLTAFMTASTHLPNHLIS